jgi:hypothetical protein
MLNQALNNRMFKTEEELRNHFGTHKLADWAAKVTQLENELREEREESEHMNRLIHRQGELLTSAVNILHGGQMENGFWSHHDIAELTQQVMDRNRDLEIRLAACEALRQHLEANLRISE